MNDRVRDKVNATLVEKLRLITAQVKENDNEYAGHFLESMLQQVDKRSSEVLDYLYHSDFLECIDSENVSFCMAVVNENASVEWLKMLQSAFEDDQTEDREASVQYVSALRYAFEHGGDIEPVIEAFENTDNAKDFAERLRILYGEAADEQAGADETVKEKVTDKPEGALDVNELQKLVSLLSEENKWLKGKNDELLARSEQTDNLLFDKKRQIHELTQTVRSLDGKLTESQREKIYEQVDYERLISRNEYLEVKIGELEDIIEKYKDDIEEYKALFNMGEEVAYIGGYTDELPQDRIDALYNEPVTVSDNMDDYRPEISESAMEADPTEDIPLDLFDVGDNEYSYFESFSNEAEDELPQDEGEEFAENFADSDNHLKQPIDNSGRNKRKLSQIFMKLFPKHYEQLFSNKEYVEQKKIVTMKLVEVKLAKEKSDIVKRALAKQASCLDLYRLIARDADIGEFERFYATI